MIYRISVGRLLCSHVRDYLAQQKLRGFQIEYHESSGLLEREFTIAGDRDCVLLIKDALEQWEP
jgi:hypothetical protein